MLQSTKKQRPSLMEVVVILSQLIIPENLQMKYLSMVILPNIFYYTIHIKVHIIFQRPKIACLPKVHVDYIQLHEWIPHLKSHLLTDNKFL